MSTNTDTSRSPVIIRATQDSAVGAALKVAGLTVIDRACKQAVRMGFTPIIASDNSCPIPAGVQVVIVADAAAASALAETQNAELVPADVVRPHNRDLKEGLRVTDAGSRRKAEDAVFAELLRGDLGFVARYCNKPISFWLTRHIFCHLPFTPNQVTVGAGIMGLIGAGALASGGRVAMLIGFLLAHAQSVLDGCDGELARVRYQQSAIGEWLDTIVDDFLNFAIFGAIGVGIWRAGGTTLDLALGLASSAMLLSYNVVAYRELLRLGEGGEVLKLRWWFTGGKDLKAIHANAEKPGIVSRVMVIGRRDFFLLAWLLIALAGQPRVALVYAFTVAFASFVVAMGQVIWRLGGGGALRP